MNENKKNPVTEENELNALLHVEEDLELDLEDLDMVAGGATNFKNIAYR